MQGSSIAHSTRRLYVARRLWLTGWLLCVSGLAAHAVPAAPNWAAQLTPLERRAQADILPLTLHYDISWSQWLQAGTVRVTVQPQSGRANAMMTAQARARSIGAVQAFWPYESSLNAEIWRQTLLPAQFDHTRIKNGERKIDRATYHQQQRMQVESTLTSASGRMKHTTHTHELEQIRDVLSLLLFLQQTELRLNQSITLLVQPTDRLYRVSLRVVGREARQVFETTWPTLKLTVSVQRVTPDLKLASYPKLRQATLWLSEVERVPVELQAELRVGSVAMRLRRLER